MTVVLWGCKLCNRLSYGGEHGPHDPECGIYPGCMGRLYEEPGHLRTALLSVAAFSKHPHPAPCGTDSCVLCLIESASAEALGDSA